MSADDDVTPRFHRGTTLFLALILCLFFCVMGSHTPLTRLASLDSPAHSARAWFERSIELDEALATRPAWERKLLDLALGRERPALAEAADAYTEVIRLQARVLRPEPAPADPGGAPASGEVSGTTSPAPSGPSSEAPSTPGLSCVPQAPQFPVKDDRERLIELLARLAVVQGETGRLDDLRGTARELEQLQRPALAHALRSAYESPGSAAPHARADFELAGLDPGWARERLELRLAERTGADARAAELRHLRTDRLGRLAQRAQLLLWTWLVPAALGLVFLLVWLWRNRPELAQANASLPPEWSFEDGFAVLTRSVLLGLVLYLGVHSLLAFLGAPLPGLWTLILLPLPLFWLIHRALLAPRAASFVRTFGLDAFPGPTWRWAALALVLFTLGELGTTAVRELFARMGVGRHWVESAGVELQDVGPWIFALATLVSLTWAPLAFELLARGVLFSTLRVRMPAGTAAAWSAALVAAFQNESLPGFVSWVWLGFVLGWSFEKSRSLLPGILCLGANGALQALAEQMLYR